MIDEKVKVQATQQVAALLVEALHSGTVRVDDQVLSPKFKRAAIMLLNRIARAEPKLIHELLDLPIPKESGERPARHPGWLQGYAYELVQNEFSIAQVAKKLGVKRSAANELINAGRDVFHQRMQEHLRRDKAKKTDE